MVSRTVAELTDDFDGSSDNVATAYFSVDGMSYEIDLTAAHLAELVEALAPYVRAGRPARPSTARRGQEHRTTVPSSNATIRAWAGAQRIDVPARGRIPQAVSDQFHAAQPGTT